MSLRVAIVGAGIMGLAAARSLALAGADVAVFEAAEASCHPHGGSHGKARITRLTYGEVDYCRLAERSYAAWDRIAEAWGEPLYRIVGGVDISLSGPDAFEGYRSALGAAGIDFEEWDATTTQIKCPQITLPNGAASLYQSETAVLHADLCAAALEAQAVGTGALIRFSAKVDHIAPQHAGVDLTSHGATERFDKVVLCAGADMRSWAASLGTGLKLTFSNEQVSYFNASDRGAHHADAMPILIFHLGSNVLSSVFPILRDDPVKAMVENNGRVSVDIEELDRLKARELQTLILPNLPLLDPVPARTETCHYILTEDNDFVLDRLPTAPNVVM